MKYYLNNLILKRYSPVIFSNKEIEAEQIDTLLEAAKWAPSSYNEQPWRFVIGWKNDLVYETILSSLMEANRIWAKEAPVLILVLSKNIFSRNGKTNRFADYDTGMAIGNLLTQATELDIFAHQMGGYNSEALRNSLNISSVFNLLSVMALGYKGDVNSAIPELKERESNKRTRNETEEIIIKPKF